MPDRKLRLAILEIFDSQANFAQALGTHQSKISEVIRGRRRLGEDEQRRWAEILRREPQELFSAQQERA